MLRLRGSGRAAHLVAPTPGRVRSMERSCWEQALARAVTDQPFQARLLADPAATLSDYGLTSQDRPLVDALRKTPTLAQLAAGFLYLAATAWAQPATATRHYAEDPILTSYPLLAQYREDPWISNALAPLDRLPHSTPQMGSTIRMPQGGAGAQEGSAP